MKLQIFWKHYSRLIKLKILLWGKGNITKILVLFLISHMVREENDLAIPDVCTFYLYNSFEFLQNHLCKNLKNNIGLNEIWNSFN